MGNLSYADQSYPRAWHTLVAAVWSSTGGGLDRAGLRSLIDVQATAAWCLPAVLSIAMGALALQAARRAGLSAAHASTAGFLAATMVLWPPFLSAYQALGFENSFVGAIVLAVVARHAMEPAETRIWPFVVVLMGIVVCANAWQLLLPALGVALVQQVRRLVRFARGARFAVAVISSLIAAVVALPGILAVVRDVGINHAADAGVKAPVPVTLVLGGLLCCGVLAVRCRGDRSITLLWVMTATPALTAIAVALQARIGLFVYYPSKLLWHSAALGLGPLAAVAVMAWSALAGHSMGAVARPARVLGTSAAALAVAFACVNPAGAFIGAWSTVRGPEVLAAVTSPEAANAQVAWLGVPLDDTISRILLDFYRVDRTSARTPQPPLSVTEECSLLREAAQPTVLSSASPPLVQARYACVPRIRVVRASAP
ncbi:hypothetical protein SAMN05216199_3642 [Pedococcus cremeus]|uniref:Uncharacterized protein n=1 Tax=Pedococcus cremeus TaxID=587636 RepID=A0A1H9XBZ9_9MICO|nr:hypothetical protein [Pedococcus cremeus]SES43652.1 hypothetical protein SAMN05216199_3642 [Pedococcus cremeus]